MVLPGHKKSIVATRFNPMRFKSTMNKCKFVYAVATLDSVVLYDTDHDTPFAMISNLHYAALTDVAWNYDGSLLFMSSTDGFCSMVEFGIDELGVLIPRAEWPVLDVQDDNGSQGDGEKMVLDKIPEDCAEEMMVDQVVEVYFLNQATIQVPAQPFTELPPPESKKRRIVPTFLGSNI
jgi:hypothetical protein